MALKGQSITIEFGAWDTSANAWKTGDNANFTLSWIKDGTRAAPTNASSEVDATNAPGQYKITLTAAEMTCSVGKLCGKSSTANISLVPTTVYPEQNGVLDTGTAAAGAAGSITLRSGFNPADGIVAGAVVSIVSGTGANQTRSIASWTSSTQVGTVDPNWTTAPDNTSLYVLYAAPQGATTTPPQVNAVQLGSQVVTAGAGITMPALVASTTNITAGTVAVATTVTNVSDKTGYTLSNTGMDNLLTRAMTEVYAADGATVTLAQFAYEVLAFLGEKNISGVTVTTKKRDGSSTAAVYTLDSGTTPTVISRTG